MEELIRLLLENIGAIVGIIAITTILAIIKKIKSDLVSEMLKAIKQASGKPYKSKMKDSIKGDANIYKELSRVLFTVRGSRVGLYQFHNGNIFSTNNPIWKISNTHEICENGVSTEIEKIQDLKASMFTQIISPVVDNMSSAGVVKIEPCKCSLAGQQCSNKIGVYRIDPDKLDNSYIHALLMGRNVKFALITPIINIDNQVTGFTMLEFCNDGHMTTEELAENSKVLCDTTSMISLILDSIEKVT